jgi:hypothetical protein
MNIVDRYINGRMAELVDALDSKSSEEIRESSTLSLPIFVIKLI